MQSPILPSIVKVDRLTYEQYKKYVEETIVYSYGATVKYSNLPSNFELDNFFNWLQADYFYVLVRNFKRIGIVVIQQVEIDNEVVTTFSTFLHPKVCKMANISLLKGALCLASISAAINQSKSLHTFLFHQLLVATIRQVYFDCKSITLSTNLYFLNIPLTTYNYQSIIDTLFNVYGEEVNDYIANI